jgi:hypothetical protein
MDFIREYSDALNSIFYQCAETFLRNYGCTPENAHEFSLEIPTHGWAAHILHNGKRIGHVETFSNVSETGVSFKTIAKPIRKIK